MKHDERGYYAAAVLALKIFYNQTEKKHSFPTDTLITPTLLSLILTPHRLTQSKLRPLPQTLPIKEQEPNTNLTQKLAFAVSNSKEEGALTTPRKLNPANKLLAGPIPRLLYNGLPYRTAPNAIRERHASLPANKDAAYGGYDIGMYEKIPRTTMKT